MQDILNEFFYDYKIKAKCNNYLKTDSYSCFDVNLISNCKIKDLEKYSKEMQLALKINTIPNFNFLPEKGIIKIEFFNNNSFKLNLSDLLETNLPGKIPCVLGKDYKNNKVIMDLSKNPHLLIAGTTGSGKTILIHNIIKNCLSLKNNNLFLIDSKKYEFSNYKNKASVFSSYEEAVFITSSLIDNMNNRYSMLEKNNNIEKLPSLVLIIDECADLLSQDKDKKLFNNLLILSQKSRASNINLILSTQRPSYDVIGGALKANFPVRIACKVASSTDSKVIIDSSGAEKLLGNGDAYIKDVNGLLRFQVAYYNPRDKS